MQHGGRGHCYVEKTLGLGPWWSTRFLLWALACLLPLLTLACNAPVAPDPEPPEPLGAMDDLNFAHGDPAATVADLDGFFAHVDGAQYAATSSVPAVATVSVAGTTLTVTPNAQPAGTTGETTVTVTATTPNGSATQSFGVTVAGPEPPEPTEPKPPESVGTMADLNFAHGDPAATVANLDGFFAHVDGAEYTATSSVPAVATVSFEGTTLTVTPNAQPAGTTGETTVTVTATTTHGSATQSFGVTVAGPKPTEPTEPKPPESVGTMADLNFAHGDGAATVADLDAFFVHIDGAQYAATSSVPAVATVSVEGTTLTVTPNAQPPGTTGETTVTVTATTTNGSAKAVVRRYGSGSGADRTHRAEAARAGRRHGRPELRARRPGRDGGQPRRVLRERRRRRVHRDIERAGGSDRFGRRHHLDGDAERSALRAPRARRR